VLSIRRRSAVGVSVETDEILDTLLVPLSGNAGRISTGQKEYAPNATVSIYLVKPGGKNELPRERGFFGIMRRPDRELKSSRISQMLR
jgi:hypothetical protein